MNQDGAIRDAEATGENLSRGLTVSVTLFCAGFGTLLFHVCAKMKVPAFLGSSFAFLGGFSTVANLKAGMYADMAANEKVAYACGGVVVAGLLYLVLALIIKLIGVKRVMRTGNHLHRPQSGGNRYQQCFYELADCDHCISDHHYF